MLTILDSARTRELPDNYPFIVQAAYIADVTAKWYSPALTLFDAVDKVVSSHVNTIVDYHFGHFGRGGLKHLVQ